MTEKTPGSATLPPTTEPTATLRILDAAANRASEGLRVIEDYVRFGLDDRYLTSHIKQIRHDLATLLIPLIASDRNLARDTRADVGTDISTAQESDRRNLQAILLANFMRVLESMRSLEEYAKLIDPHAAGRMEQLRYQLYSLQKSITITVDSNTILQDARLYVLVDQQADELSFITMIEALVSSGVDIIQLRAKSLSDRELLSRAHILRDFTRNSETLFIMNDRPDLAVLGHADGVHVGQEELSVKDVRSIVGTNMLIGVSTHSLEQARCAVDDGANYIGMGPTFPSSTKSFTDFTGLDIVRAISAEVTLPAFAIGGISPDNIPDIVAAGGKRVAVGAAITQAENPAQAVEKCLAQLR